MGDHFLVVGLSTCGGGVVERLLVFGQGEACGCQGFGGDAGTLDGDGRGRLPVRVIPPVDIWAIAAAIGAAVATPHQEVACGDVQTIGRDFPICSRLWSVGW